MNYTVYKQIKLKEDTYIKLWNLIVKANSRNAKQKNYTNLSFDDIINELINKKEGELNNGNERN